MVQVLQNFFLFSENDVRLSPADKMQQKTSLIMEFQNQQQQQHNAGGGHHHQLQHGSHLQHGQLQSNNMTHNSGATNNVFTAFRDPVEALGECYFMYVIK